MNMWPLDCQKKKNPWLRLYLFLLLIHGGWGVVTFDGLYKISLIAWNFSPSISTVQQPSDLQNRISPASVPPIWEFDLPLSTLLTTQSMPTRYSSTISSDSGPTVSVPQVIASFLNSNIHYFFNCSELGFQIGKASADFYGHSNLDYLYWFF